MDNKDYPNEQKHATLEVTLEQVWIENKDTVYLGFCSQCGRLNIKIRVIGHFDDWTITCPGCMRLNHVNSLRFKIQTRQ